MRTLTKIIFYLIILNISFTQFNAGSKTISGDISWGKEFYDGENYISRIKISPNVGYFVVDNIAINLAIDKRKTSYHSSENEYKSTELMLGFKYHFQYLYVGGAYNTLQFEDSSDGNSSVLFDCGYLYGLNRSIFIDTGLDYILGIGDNQSSSITTTIGIATFF